MKRNWLRKIKRYMVLLLTASFLSQAVIGAFNQPIITFAQTESNLATHVVISEVYGGGGNSGATYTNDFIELYNPTNVDISLEGWSVQYASATGTSWQLTTLTGSIRAYSYYMIQEAQGTGGSVPLPTPDATGMIALSGSKGKIALVNHSTTLTGENPVDSGLIDFVGYGAANAYEGTSSTPALTNTTSATRKTNENNVPTLSDLLGNGWDSNDNGMDFITSTPEPQNSASPVEGGTPVADTTAPVVLSKAPDDLQSGVNRSGTVSATYDENIFEGNTFSTIVIKNAEDQVLEGVIVQIEGKKVSLSHPEFLYKKSYTIVFPEGALKDAAENVTAAMSWSFETEEETHPEEPVDGDYHLYFGQLHSHTNLSDGQGTPEEAYGWAKSQGQADFFAVTDHSNWFDQESDKTNEGITQVNQSTSNEWKRLNQVADSYTVDGEFVGIAGYEMTWSNGTGHINTFNTPWFVSRSNTTMTLQNYYSKLAAEPNSISQFNHPGNTFGDFNDFGNYSVEADAVVDLIEVGNGEGAVGSAGYFESYAYYTKALDKGWHVAPTNNQDNHKGNWITANEARTVALAPTLTRQSLYEAFKALRVYATEDRNLEISYKINDQVMGATLTGSSELNFDIQVKDPDQNEHIGTISIIAEGGIVVKEEVFSTNDASWSFQLSPEYAYYYVQINEADGDKAVTAPIWNGEVNLIGLSKLEASQNPTIEGTQIELAATVYNNSNTLYNNATIEFYQGSADGIKLGEATISTINGGAQAQAKINWITGAAGIYEIYAKTTIQDKTFIKSTQIKVLSPQEAVKVVIDGGHANAYITGYYAGKYTGLLNALSSEEMVPSINLDNLTADDLKDAGILILSDPESSNAATKAFYSADELAVIQAFVQGGGSVIITSRADFGEASYGSDYQNATQGNNVLAAIGSNLRFNDDEVWDDVNYDGSNYRLLFNQYETSVNNLTQLYDATKTFRIYSGCSVILEEAAQDESIEWLVKVHPTTISFDSDLSGDAKPLQQGEFYVLAAETLTAGGKVIAASSTFFSDFEIAASDNTFTNIEILHNILNWMGTKGSGELKTISEVRVDQNSDNIPDLNGEVVTVEGYVTSESEAYSKVQNHDNAFFEVVYVQDATAGITVFGISTKELPLGAKVSITGRVEHFEGDTEIHVLDEAQDVKVLDGNWRYVQARKMSTSNSMQETNEGWLVQINGQVTSMTDNTLYINDGSGDAKVYLNGYIGDGSGNAETLGKWDPTIQIGDTLSVIGLASEDSQGPRLRVRDASEIQKLSGTNALQLNLLGQYQSKGADGTSAGVAEIVKYDATVQKAYIVNGAAKSIDIVDLSDLESDQAIKDIVIEKSIDLESLAQILDHTFTAGDITSLDIHPSGAYLAVTVQEADKTKKGRVVFLNMEGQYLSQVTVGYWPDQVTFSPDGHYLLVANEGEPTDDYAQDPQGSVSVIDTSGEVSKITDSQVTDIGFEGVTMDADVIIKAGATAATDLEPEYITVSSDSSKAYIVMQENNAVAALNLVQKQMTHIYGLGNKDFSLSALDASDKDKKINITSLPVLGLYQPDGMSLMEINGKSYILTANEGDTREWGSYNNASRVKNIEIALDADCYAGYTQEQIDQLTATLKSDKNLGRLNIHNELGLNAEGQYEALYTFGGRSFSIWDAEDFSLVYDSGDDFEQVTALLYPDFFNISNDNLDMDDRSDNKGPEPEGITLGKIGAKTYAFVGLERTGGIMVYDVTDPIKPAFVTYTTSRDFQNPVGGDSGPEGLEYISSLESPTGTPLLLAANETSGTLAIYQITGKGIVPIEETEQIKVKIETPFQSLIKESTSQVEFYYSVNDAYDLNALDVTFKFDQESLRFNSVELISNNGQLAFTVKDNMLRVVTGFIEPINTHQYTKVIKILFDVVDTDQAIDEASVMIHEAESASKGTNREVISSIENSTAQITLYALNKLCDVNADSIVDISDLSIALEAYRATNEDSEWNQKKKADVNLDGVVDITDFTIIIAQILK